MPDFFNFAAPGTTGGPQQTMANPGLPLNFTNPPPFLTPGTDQPVPGIWDKLVNAIGQVAPPKMPGTTIGAPAGAPGMAPAQLPPMLPQTQMQRPPGIPNLSALLNPTAGAGSNSLMAQYMALQQLMRGA
jgi:hypothetical protein